MLNAASLPAGTSIVPVAFWPRAAVAVPTVKVARSCAEMVIELSKIKTSPTARIMRRGINQLLSSTARGFFGADAGRRAHQKLVVLSFSRWFPSQQSAQDSADETQRNAEYARILEREDRLRLNQVSRGGCAGRIDSHDARADDDQQDRRH